MTSSGGQGDDRASLTMLDVERAIESHRAEFVQQPFLRRLEGGGTAKQFCRMLPCMAFYTLVFQDVLRTAKLRSSDPVVRAMAARHELEDKGHDQWYLDDARKLGVTLDIEGLFSAEHEFTRDIGYELMSEILTVVDDSSRLAMVLSLEAIGREFFLRAPGFATRAGFGEGLKYFALRHLDIERDHEVFRSESQNQLAKIQVSAEVMPKTLRAIRRTFDAMTRLASHLEQAMSGG